MGSSQRVCIGCRQPDERGALLRFVLAGDPPTVVPDIRRRDQGRGASTHPRYGCLSRAVASGGFQRAFKRKLDLSAPALAGWARGQYERRIDGLLQAAGRSGGLALGTDAARAALGQGAPELLVVARDAAGRREELRDAAERLGARCVVVGDKQHLGALFGRPELGVIAVLDGRIAGEIRDAARCAAELAEEA